MSGLKRRVAGALTAEEVAAWSGALMTQEKRSEPETSLKMLEYFTGKTGVSMVTVAKSPELQEVLNNDKERSPAEETVFSSWMELRNDLCYTTLCSLLFGNSHQWNLLLWKIHWMKSLLYRAIQAEVKNHSIGPALRQVMETNYTLLTFCGWWSMPPAG